MVTVLSRVVPVALLCVTVCVTACSAGGVPEVAGDVAPPDGVSLSFGQLRNDEGTDRAQLRVENRSSADLTVTGVGLDWPGYGDFLADYTTVVEAGRVLDLRFRLPEPACTPADAPVVGRLRVASPDGDRVYAARLDATGAGHVTRIRQRRCEDLAVARDVELSYGEDWRLVGSGRRTRLVGAVTVGRRAAVGRLTLQAIRGSVLLQVDLPGPLRLAAADDSATSPVTVTVPRCDRHALVDSSQTFHFEPVLAYADGDVVQVYREPPARTRQAAQRLLELACVVGGTVD